MFKEKKSTLSAKILIYNIVLVGFISLICLAISINFTFNLSDTMLIDNLKNTAYIISKSYEVINTLEQEDVNTRLNDFLDDIVDNDKNVDIITIADMTRTRYYHIDKTKIGAHVVGDDDYRVLEGEHYSSVATGTQGHQTRYFYPVYNETGDTQIGFVVVGTLTSNMHDLRMGMFQSYAQSIFILISVWFSCSIVLSTRIKTSLLGYEPDKITQIFLQREDIMNSLNEGLIAIDLKGKIIFFNNAARELFDVKDENLNDKDVQKIFPQLKMSDVINSGEPICNLSTIHGETIIIYDKIPIRDKKKLIGAVAILRNRTEVTKLAEQLTGVNHIIHALRANTHEFMNKLHVILGLLQLGEHEDAQKYILGIVKEQENIINSVVKNIENKTIAALILAKISRAKELGVSFNLHDSSCLPAHNKFLPTSSIVTIIGNLIENSFDAINEDSDREKPKEVAMFIYLDDQGIVISVDDTGVGMTESQVNKFKESGYSTKGADRGVGMSLVQSILDNNEGTIDIYSELGVGTSITIAVSKPR